MCGCYATTRTSVDLSELFGATDDLGGALEPDYNVAPTDPVPIVRTSTGGPAGDRLLSTARWGLVPHWAKDLRAGARMINARSETVPTSNAFASSFARRRCLVPADGWYEWVKVSAAAEKIGKSAKQNKQAYYLTPADGGVLAFAGLWAAWGPDKVLTCSIITAPAVGDLALIHDRMPLVLPPERWADWLGAEPDESLLLPPPTSVVAG